MRMGRKVLTRIWGRPNVKWGRVGSRSTERYSGGVAMATATWTDVVGVRSRVDVAFHYRGSGRGVGVAGYLGESLVTPTYHAVQRGWAAIGEIKV